MGRHLEFAPHTALPGLGLDLSWLFRNLSPLDIGNRDFFQGSLKFLDPSGPPTQIMSADASPTMRPSVPSGLKEKDSTRAASSLHCQGDS